MLPSAAQGQNFIPTIFVVLAVMSHWRAAVDALVGLVLSLSVLPEFLHLIDSEMFHFSFCPCFPLHRFPFAVGASEAG